MNHFVDGLCICAVPIIGLGSVASGVAEVIGGEEARFGISVKVGAVYSFALLAGLSVSLPVAMSYEPVIGCILGISSSYLCSSLIAKKITEFLFSEPLTHKQVGLIQAGMCYGGFMVWNDFLEQNK